MADQREQIVLDVDERPAVQASARANTALDSVEKKAGTVSDKATKAIADTSQRIVSITDRSNNAIQRNLDSFQRKLDSITKSPSDKLAGDKDILLKRIAGDPAAVQRATDLWTKFRAEQDKAAQGTAIKQLGADVKEFVENPLAAAGNAASKLLTSLGTGGIVAGVVASGLLAVGVAGYEAAKSLGEYGVGIRDVQLRTGLTTKEVGQFSFAAKAAGSDVSVFERSMKGLTSALDDNSSGSDKARNALQKLGVQPRDLEGNLKPTSEILLQISDGLNKIPSAIDRDKVAIDIFKKSGIDAIPVLIELRDNLELARDLGLGPADNDIKKFQEYNREIALADARWAKLGRDIQEPLADTYFSAKRTLGVLESVYNLIGDLGHAPKPAPPGQDEEANRRQKEQDAIKAAGGPEALQKNAQSLSKYLDSGLEGAQAKLAILKTAYDEARTSAESLTKGAGLLPDAAAKARAEVESTRSAYQAQSETVKLLEKDETKRIANLEKIKDLTLAAQGFLRLGSGANETIIAGADIAEANRRSRTPSLFRPNELNPFSKLIVPGDLSEGPQVIPGQGSVFVSPTNSRIAAGSDDVKARMDADLKLIDDDRQARLDAITAEADATEKLLQLRGAGSGGEIELARQTAAIRQSALDQELQITGDINRYREASLKNQIDLQLKMAEESKREFDNIKSTVANLTQTLFDKPSQFGSQLAGVLKKAITEPISEGVGGFFAKRLQPLIYGKDGQSGIAGRLGHISKLEQPNHLGDVGLVNGAVPVLIMNPGASSSSGLSGAAAAPFGGLAGGLGGIFSGLGGLTGLAGLGGSAAPAGAVTSTINFGDGPISTGVGSIFGSGSILGGPGGTTGFAGDVGNLAGGAGSGGGSGAGGLLGLLKNLGGGGGGASAASFAPLGLLGSALGLGGAFKLGQSSNPLSKALAPVLGGVSGLVGFGSLASLFPALVAAGPVGWIAAAGIGITVGLLGNFFKTASQKTHDKIKSVYGVDVTDQGVLSQITQTIKQSYGGDIDLGIQSQQVRELISLYAMTTGQSSKGIVQTVTPSAFSNTGGQLTQLPTYVNGQPTYPTYGSAQTGGGSLTPAVTPMTLQLDGPATTALLQGQAAQVIASSPRLISSQAAAGQTSSAGRRQAAANLLSPSFLTS